jgi:alpha-glucoside transport system permease protein
MIEQIVGAILTVLIGVAGCVVYFWGTNWLLDRFLATNQSMTGEVVTRRDYLRSQVRPWLFLAPALVFLTVYLIYPCSRRPG